MIILNSTLMEGTGRRTGYWERNLRRDLKSTSKVSAKILNSHHLLRYPKQQRLLALKKAAVTEHALHATYLSLEKLPTLPPLKFDVILIDPPFSSSFSWDHLEKLPIPALAADPSFVFLWVGSGAGDGLERGREILGKWGYRRCEDVTWVKTNKSTNRGPGVCFSLSIFHIHY